jgi:hypothetical protein
MPYSGVLLIYSTWFFLPFVNYVGYFHFTELQMAVINSGEVGLRPLSFEFLSSNLQLILYVNNGNLTNTILLYQVGKTRPD